MDLAMHQSVYVSTDLFTRLSIELAIKSHCTYPLLCFKNRCLPELPLRYFPSSAYGCTIAVGDKTDAKRRRDTDGSEKTPSFQRSNDNTGNNMVTCCRLESAARKDTRSIESRASKTGTCENCATVAGFGDKTDAESGRHTDGSEKTPSVQRSNDNTGNDKVTSCKIGSAARQDTRSIESENRLFPRTQPRPAAEDEIFALPFRHAPTRDHSVYSLSRDEDTHGVPSHRPSASEWATCYGLSKSSIQKWHPQKQDASASTAKAPHFHQERPADPLPPRAVRLFWSRTGALRPRCASTQGTGPSPTHQFSTSPVQCWPGVAYSPWPRQWRAEKPHHRSEFVRKVASAKLIVAYRVHYGSWRTSHGT